MSNNTSTYSELLRKNGRFPDDYIFIGYRDDKLKFKNKNEGFVIELDEIMEE